ncbi:MAG: C39 family peptidase [Patescibacteria group bacterium]
MKIKNAFKFIFVIAVFSAIFLDNRTPIVSSATTAPVSKIDLAVPHIWEIPDGVWVNPWSNACEEASIIMVEEFYLKRGEVKFTDRETKTKVSPLFVYENKVFGSNADSNSTRTLRIINENSFFTGFIKKNPTVEEIKEELLNGHPVISFHYGIDLKNPKHRWRVGGSAFHVLVINGFDDKTKEFLVNDSELKNGLDYHYKYDIILNSLHDFDHASKKTDGEPVVIFTRPRRIVKVAGKSPVYLIENGKKYYITHPKVFKNRGWSWKYVEVITQDELYSYTAGEPIRK